jgi:hypothetical protein
MNSVLIGLVLHLVYSLGPRLSVLTSCGISTACLLGDYRVVLGPRGVNLFWKVGGWFKVTVNMASVTIAARSASHTAWGPGARLRAPVGGPGGKAPGSFCHLTDSERRIGAKMSPILWHKCHFMQHENRGLEQLYTKKCLNKLQH